MDNTVSDSRQNLRVLQMVGSIGQSVGGPPRSVTRLCKELGDNGIDVSLATAFWKDDPNVTVDRNVRLIEIPGSGCRIAGIRWVRSFLPPIENHFKENIPDVVHIHGLWLNSCRETAQYGRRHSIPLVISPRGMLEPWSMNHKKWKKKIVWNLFQARDLKKANAFHATACSEAKSIRSLGFKQPIAVIPNGIDLPEEHPPLPVSGSCSRKHTALFLSRVNPKKGLPMLLDAWKSVAPENWRLIIAGNDDSGHLNIVRQKIENLELNQCVEVAGPLFGKAKEKAFQNADLFVLPSYSENFGIVVAEALGYSIPVVTTKGCPWRQLVEHDCGWWVEANVADLAEALAGAFASGDERLKMMGARGRTLVETEYQWPSIGTKMTTFFRWLKEGGARPDFVV